MKTLILIAIALISVVQLSVAKPKEIKVFIALCDNETQGVAPVGEKIGNGNDAGANLYWGCSDGFGAYFKKSKKWKVVSSEVDVSEQILRRMKLKHASNGMEISADAYRGSKMKQCLIDFESAAASGKYDLVAFIGHNGLMDFELPTQKPIDGNKTDAVVLCCLSDKYFSPRLKLLGCKPILMTRQFMYPGSFLLHDALEKWNAGGSLNDIRNAAGRAYASNQKISVKAATGVFSKL